MKLKPPNSIFTEEQWQAIVHNGENILVSAGAGSGKTAVLTQRIIEKIKDGIKLENLIVLTFTKASAAEMKERIRNQLIKEQATNNNCQSELKNIDNSFIMTFDSYSMYILKKYSYLLNIDSQIEICDKLIIEKEKNLIIDNIFNNLFLTKDQDFLQLIDQFTMYSDQTIKKNILQIYYKYQMSIEPIKIDDYYTDEMINLIIEQLEDKLIQLSSYIFESIDAIEKIESDILADYLVELRLKVSSLFTARKYNDFKGAIDSSFEIKFPRLSSKKYQGKEKVGSINKEIKETYTKIVELVDYQSIKEIKLEIISSKDNIKVIDKILKELDYQLNQFKFESNLYEYIDINKLSIKIVQDNTFIREYLIANTNEIMIDEYQDTSDIQENFINLISNNNQYMVGDAKQSIYQFRNANINNFQTKYKHYKNNDGGKLILLNKNFRSREVVLNNINTIFQTVMQDKKAIEYNQDQYLIYGNKQYDNTKEDNQLDIIMYDSKVVELEKEEFEIKQIIIDIQTKIRQKYQIYDLKQKQFRDCEYTDFAILTTKRKSFSLFKSLFDQYQIPLDLTINESFSVSSEVNIIKNIIHLILSQTSIKYKQKHYNFSLIATMRSFIFEYSDQYIDQVMTKQQECNEITEKCLQISNKIELKSIYTVVIETIEKFNVYSSIYKLKDPILAEKNINYLLMLATKLDDMHYTITDFIKYLEEVEVDIDKVSKDFEFSTPKPIKINSVSLQTIHSSKGLEYNICYFPHLFSKINEQELNDNFLFDQQFGFACSSVNENNNLSTSLLQTIYRDQKSEKLVSEYIRLFYVALTRTKDQIILIVNQNDLVTKGIKKDYKSFANMLAQVTDTFKSREAVNLDQLISFEQKVEKINLQDKKINNLEIKNNVQIINKSRPSMKSISIGSNQLQDNLMLGNKIHQELEFFDFNNYQTAVNVASQYVKNVIDVLDKLNLLKFENKYYPEFEFSYLDNGKATHGIIDLLIKDQNNYIIIDYKLNDIEKKEYIEQLDSYIKYIQTISSHQVNAYLVSISKKQFKKVN